MLEISARLRSNNSGHDLIQKQDFIEFPGVRWLPAPHVDLPTRKKSTSQARNIDVLAAAAAAAAVADSQHRLVDILCLVIHHLYSQAARLKSECIARKPQPHRSSRPRNVGKSGRHLPKTPIALAADTSPRRRGPSTAACTPDGRGAEGPSRLFSCPGRRRTSRSRNRSRKSSPYPPVGDETRS